MKQQLEQIIVKYCTNCKERTEHTEHGFKYSNYRLRCTVCDKESWDWRNLT